MPPKKKIKNEQPYYHALTILFTATQDIQEEELKHVLTALKKVKHVLPDSIEIDSFDAEPGDPADLL